MKHERSGRLPFSESDLKYASKDGTTGVGAQWRDPTDDLLVGFENVRVIRLVIDGADRFRQLGGGEVRRPAEVAVGDRGNGLSTLSGIDLGAGGRDQGRRRRSL